MHAMHSCHTYAARNGTSECEAKTSTSNNAAAAVNHTIQWIPYHSCN
jgi:hypothetical protein